MELLPTSSPISLDHYFDYAATTPLDPQVRQCLVSHWEQNWGNAGAMTHGYGRQAAATVAQARQQVASLLHADPREIIFTSGATESNNLALQGAFFAHSKRGKHVITVQTEHKAVLDPLKFLASQGATLTVLPVDRNGVLSLDALRDALRPETILVSVMAVNNETGVIQPLDAIADRVKSHGALLHVDAAQAVGKLPLDVNTLPVDLLSVSSHKIYGPVGVGALFVRRLPKARIAPLMFGGGQEQGLRPGTLPTPLLSALGLACELADQRRAALYDHCQQLTTHLLARLQTALDGVHCNGEHAPRVPHIINVCIDGIDAEALLGRLRPTALALGSACTAAQLEPSHVLRAMGLTDAQARSSLRMSVGAPTTLAAVDDLANRCINAVTVLRRAAPI